MQEFKVHRGCRYLLREQHAIIFCAFRHFCSRAKKLILFHRMHHAAFLPGASEQSCCNQETIRGAPVSQSVSRSMHDRSFHSFKFTHHSQVSPHSLTHSLTHLLMASVETRGACEFHPIDNFAQHPLLQWNRVCMLRNISWVTNCQINICKYFYYFFPTFCNGNLPNTYSRMARYSHYGYIVCVYISQRVFFFKKL